MSYSIYGERGSIDILGWHPATRLALVVEVKTELLAVEETLRKHDEKVRLAPRINADLLGWRPMSVARLLVLPSLSTARRRVDRHRDVMASAYPVRGVELRRRLAAPVDAFAGILFLDIPAGDATAAPPPRKRIRRGRPAA